MIGLKTAMRQTEKIALKIILLPFLVSCLGEQIDPPESQRVRTSQEENLEIGEGLRFRGLDDFAVCREDGYFEYDDKVSFDELEVCFRDLYISREHRVRQSHVDEWLEQLWETCKGDEFDIQYTRVTSFEVCLTDNQGSFPDNFVAAAPGDISEPEPGDGGIQIEEPGDLEPDQVPDRGAPGDLRPVLEADLMDQLSCETEYSSLDELACLPDNYKDAVSEGRFKASIDAISTAIAGVVWTECTTSLIKTVFSQSEIDTCITNVLVDDVKASNLRALSVSLETLSMEALAP